MLVNFNKELFSLTLKDLRGPKSQSDLGDELNINRATVSLMENGKQIPSLELLQKVCDKSNIAIDDFFSKEAQNPVLLMMGQLRESDKPKLTTVIGRIKIREKYIAISKRCD